MNELLKIKSDLKDQLQKELPGEAVQLQMAPVFRKPAEAYGDKILTATKAAVMLLIFDYGHELSTLLIQRTAGGIHASQIALPGGKCEKEDLDEISTALRECNEEIAIPLNEIEVLGKLSPVYIPPSNYLVTPVVGWYSGKHDFTLAEDEVTRIIVEPVATFLDPSKVFTASFVMHTGVPTDAPAYQLKTDVMWGATAMMFSEFAAVLKKII